MGEPRARAVTTFVLLLPGATITYYGEEIGMTEGYISWEDTVDPLGCTSNKAQYQSVSRDPARTPFQWNNSVSAGKLPTSYNFHTEETVFGPIASFSRIEKKFPRSGNFLSAERTSQIQNTIGLTFSHLLIARKLIATC